MDNLDLIEFLRNHLKIRVIDVSSPSTCGGDIEGTLGVKVQLLVGDEVISEDVTSLYQW